MFSSNSAVEAEEVDFIVLTEDYSRFTLKDGTVIKAKIVLKKVFFSLKKSPEGYPIAVDFDAMNSIVAIVPNSLKKEPSTERLDMSIEKGTEISTVEEVIKSQQYKTENEFRISIKPFLVKVFRYDKFNNYGEPIYNVILQAITNVDKLESSGEATTAGK